MGEQTTNAEMRKRYEDGSALNTHGSGDHDDTVPEVATSSSAEAPTFGTWSEPDADRPSLVTIEVAAETDGTSNASVVVDSDEEGDDTSSYNINLAGAPGDLSAGTLQQAATTVYVPVGGQIRVNNTADPNDNNSIVTTRQVTL